MDGETREPHRDVERSRRPRGLQRTLLRALNGAAVGTLLGLPIGALLLPFFAAFDPGMDIAGYLASSVLGGVLGAMGGFLIGPSIVIREDSRRLRVGTGVGLTLGSLLALPVILFAPYAGWGALALVASGLIGGYAVSACLCVIRKRWRWWTRFEE